MWKTSQFNIFMYLVNLTLCTLETPKHVFLQIVTKVKCCILPLQEAKFKMLADVSYIFCYKLIKSVN